MLLDFMFMLVQRIAIASFHHTYKAWNYRDLSLNLIYFTLRSKKEFIGLFVCIFIISKMHFQFDNAFDF